MTLEIFDTFMQTSQGPLNTYFINEAAQYFCFRVFMHGHMGTNLCLDLKRAVAKLEKIPKIWQVFLPFILRFLV